MPDLDLLFAEGSADRWKWMISEEENNEFEEVENDSEDELKGKKKKK